MPKINFNVPFLNDKGEPVLQPKKKSDTLRMNDKGQMMPEFEVGADGVVAQEPVTVRQLVAQVLGTAYEGDAELPFAVRAKRGKLARRIAMADGEIGITTKHAETIMKYAEKGASITLIAQLDDMINGEGENDEEA